MVAGIVLAIVIADRRYRKAGGARGVILDVAAWAVPAGLIPAALAALLDHAQAGPLVAVRSWDLAAGFPAAVACGAAGAWACCRQMRARAARSVAAASGRLATGPGRAGVAETAGGVAPVPPDRVAALAREQAAGGIARRGVRLRLGPVAGAVAPALLFGHAVAMIGQWVTQRGYGRPSSLWWAVAISPAHRAQGLENFATFQPVFAYQALSDVALGIAVIWIAHRWAPSGGQLLALACAGYAATGFALFWLGIAHSPAVLGLRATGLGEVALLIGAVAYLTRTRRKRGVSSQLGSKDPLERSRPVM